LIFDYPDAATPLDPDEIEGLKFRHVDTRSELNQLEQQNIQDGLKWLERQKSIPELLSESFVRRLHKELFGNVWSWAGSFRLSEKNLGVDPANIGVELRNLLDDSSYWIEHGTFSHLEIAVRLHHRLVQIHAFVNGNGRHARIMTDVVLGRLLDEPWLSWGNASLDDQGKVRSAYINALRQADKGDYAPLIAFLS
jgi:Fic-DOC domain mobile mystery protein B